MYFPKSQIKTDLYTKGNLLRNISTKEMYIGDYFEVSNGKYYSGKNPTDSPVTELELIPNNSEEYYNKTNNFSINPSIGDPIIDEQEDADQFEAVNSTAIFTLPTEYLNAVNLTFENNITSPKSHFPSPTKEDYNFGEIQRYYLKKINSYNFIEINLSTYEQYLQKQPTVQYPLYTLIRFSWQISGEDVDKIATINYNTLKLTQKRLNIKGLLELFKGKYNQFYKKIGL